MSAPHHKILLQLSLSQQRLQPPAGKECNYCWQGVYYVYCLQKLWVKGEHFFQAEETIFTTIT